MSVKAVFFLIRLLEGFGMGSFFPIYSPWLELHGLNFFKMGTVNFFYHISASVLDPFTGYLADKLGKRRAFVIGQLFWTSTQFIYGASTNIGGFMLAEGIASIGHSLKSDALESWLQNKLGSIESGKVMGSAEPLFTVGQISTSILAGYISFEYGMKVAWMISGSCFLVATLLGGIALYLAGSDLDDTVVHNATTSSLRELLSIVRKAYGNKTIRKGAFLVFMFNFSSKSVFMYWPQVTQTLGLSAELRGFVILAISIPIMIGSLLAGHSFLLPQNKLGLTRMLTLLGIGLLCTYIAKSLILFLVGLVMIEVAYGSSRILMYGHLYDEIDKASRATISSLISSVRTLGGALSLLVMGQYADLFNPQATYALGGLTILLFAYIYSKQK